MKEKKIVLSEEQQRALDAMLSGKNVFLSGDAGTGKSVVIEEFKKYCTDRTVFLAPTGKAAQNISGQTVHSFFGFPIGVLTDELLGDITPEEARLLESVDTIVIDEISMVRVDVFDAIEDRLFKYRRDSSFHFWGNKQIIVVGDFMQIAPVCSTFSESHYLNQKFGGFFAFNSPAWEGACFENIVLKEVHRQSDQTEKAILNAIRIGDVESKSIYMPDLEIKATALDAFNHQVRLPWRISNDVTKLCTTRKNVDYFNRRGEKEVSGDSYSFTAEIIGTFPVDSHPVPENLDLKIGSYVMTVNNKRNSHTNGDTGFITEVNDGGIVIKLKNGRVVTVDKYRWEHLKYYLVEIEDGVKTIRQQIVGYFTQYPVVPAHSMTVHKAQGATLDEAVFILDNGCFADGQLYTALSRTRSLAKLYMDRELKAEDVKVNAEALEFYRNLK